MDPRQALLPWRFKQISHNTALLTPDRERKYPKRLVRRLYESHKWDTSKEKKWSDTNDSERLKFASAAVSLRQRIPTIEYLSMTVYKPRVQDHIRDDANKLYNYMIGLLLLDRMATFDTVTFVPDPRSIKVRSGNSMHDYLQTRLWFDLEAKTKLITDPCDSQNNLNVQFSDMLSGAVQSHYELAKSMPYKKLSSHLTHKTLFF